MCEPGVSKYPGVLVLDIEDAVADLFPVFPFNVKIRFYINNHAELNVVEIVCLIKCECYFNFSCSKTLSIIHSYLQAVR